MAKATMTQTVEVTIQPKVAAQIRKELTLYAGLKHQEKAITRQLDTSRENVLQLGVEHDLPNFELDGHKVALVLDGVTNSFDKELALKLMVQAGLSVAKAKKVIAGATKTTPKKAYAAITLSKEAKENAHV